MKEQAAAAPDLLPCPHCGSDRITVWSIRDGQQAVCKDCKSTGAPVFHGPAGWAAVRPEAIAAWNRRAPITQAAGEANPLPSDMEAAERELRAALDGNRMAVLTPFWIRAILSSRAKMGRVETIEECARAVESAGYYRDENGEQAAAIIRSLKPNG